MLKALGFFAALVSLTFIAVGAAARIPRQRQTAEEVQRWQQKRFTGSSDWKIALHRVGRMEQKRRTKAWPSGLAPFVPSRPHYKSSFMVA